MTYAILSPALISPDPSRSSVKVGLALEISNVGVLSDMVSSSVAGSVISSLIAAAVFSINPESTSA